MGEANQGRAGQSEQAGKHTKASKTQHDGGGKLNKLKPKPPGLGII